MTFKIIKTLHGFENCVRISRFNRLLIISLKHYTFQTISRVIKNVYTSFDKITLYPSKTVVKNGNIIKDLIETNNSLFMTNKNSLNVQDIELFYTISEKKDNDTSNKIRERILEYISAVPQSFKEHDTYGNKWVEIKEKWQSVFSSNISSIERKAGRTYNYDFLVILENGEEIKVEFKHNCTKISKLPQILSLSTCCDILPVSYAEYYYDNYLEKVKTIMKVDEPITKQDYMKYIHTINHNSHELFVKMREHENNNKDKVDELVNESIKNFLEKNKDKVDISNLINKLNKALDKVYVMWDLGNKKFITENIKDDFKNISVSRVKNNNTLVISTENYNYMFLLRWRNHKGIMNPAWQVSINEK